jgi:hypothetical protein
MSDVETGTGLTTWLKRNQLWGTIAGMASGALVTGSLWYSSVNTMSAEVTKLTPRVDLIAKDLEAAKRNIEQYQKDMTNADLRMNQLRTAIDNGAITLQQVRQELQNADYVNREAIAVLSERTKGLEFHSPPLTFAPPAKGAQR